MTADVGIGWYELQSDYDPSTSGASSTVFYRSGPITVLVLPIQETSAFPSTTATAQVVTLHANAQGVIGLLIARRTQAQRGVPPGAHRLYRLG